MGLTAEGHGDFLFTLALYQFRREPDSVKIVALGDEPRLLREQSDMLAFKQIDLGPRLHVVQPQQRLAGADPVAVPHEDLGDYASLVVLNGLAVRIDLERAGGDHGGGQRRRGRPSGETAKPKDDQGRAEQNGFADRGTRRHRSEDMDGVRGDDDLGGHRGGSP